MDGVAGAIGELGRGESDAQGMSSSSKKRTSHSMYGGAGEGAVSSIIGGEDGGKGGGVEGGSAVNAESSLHLPSAIGDSEEVAFSSIDWTTASMRAAVCLLVSPPMDS